MRLPKQKRTGVATLKRGGQGQETPADASRFNDDQRPLAKGCDERGEVGLQQMDQCVRARIVEPKEDDGWPVGVRQGEDLGKVQIHGEDDAMFPLGAAQEREIRLLFEMVLGGMVAAVSVGSQPRHHAGRHRHIGQKLHGVWTRGRFCSSVCQAANSRA